MAINKHRIYYFLLLAVAATIPFSPTYHFSGYFIIALTLSWILLSDWKAKWNKLWKNPVSFVFLLYYPVLLLGLIYSSDLKEAKFLLEKSLALFILPLVILSGPAINNEKVLKAGTSFVLGCSFLSLFALVKASYLTFTYGNIFLDVKKGETYFYYHVLSNLAGIHPTYFSMFVSFSALLVGIHTYLNWKSFKKFTIFLRIFLFIYFLFFMYLLSGRMAFISFFFISFTIVLYNFYKNGKMLLGIGMVTVIVALIFYILSNLWHTKMRFYYLIHPNTGEWRGANTRNEFLNKKVHWGCYWEAIKENNLLIGAGTGDWWNEIAPCYNKWDFIGHRHKYNAHNQYIEIMLRHGLIGLFVWLACLSVPVWHYFFGKKDVYYTVFIILFSLSCMTETMLDRQHGVVFYAFFNAIFASRLFTKN